MRLTEEEQEIVDLILDGKVTDISSYIFNSGKYDVVEMVSEISGCIHDNHNNKYSISDIVYYNLQGERKQVYSGAFSDVTRVCFLNETKYLATFIRVVRTLEDSGLILSRKSDLNDSRMMCFLSREEKVKFDWSKIITDEMKETIRDSYKIFEDLNISEEQLKKILIDMPNQETSFEKLVERRKKIGKPGTVMENEYYLLGNTEIMNFVDEFMYIQIVPLIGLKDFKDNIYQTEKELDRIHNDKIVKKYQDMTILVSVMSVLVALVLGGLSLYNSNETSNVNLEIATNNRELLDRQNELIEKIKEIEVDKLDVMRESEDVYEKNKIYEIIDERILEYIEYVLNKIVYK